MDILEDLYYGNLFPHENVQSLMMKRKSCSFYSTEMKKSSLQLFPMSRKKPLKIQGLQSGNF